MQPPNWQIYDYFAALLADRKSTMVPRAVGAGVGAVGTIGTGVVAAMLNPQRWAVVVVSTVRARTRRRAGIRALERTWRCSRLTTSVREVVLALACNRTPGATGEVAESRMSKNGGASVLVPVGPTR